MAPFGKKIETAAPIRYAVGATKGEWEMPARCASFAASRFVSHWFGDLEPGSENANLFKKKYSDSCGSLFDVIHTEVLAAPQEVANAHLSAGKYSQK